MMLGMATYDWMTVEIEPGMFPSERVVKFKSADGDVAIFVPISQINEERRSLKIVVLDEDAEMALVQIQSQDGRTVARVPLGSIKREHAPFASHQEEARHWERKLRGKTFAAPGDWEETVFTGSKVGPSSLRDGSPPSAPPSSSSPAPGRRDRRR